MAGIDARIDGDRFVKDINKKIDEMIVNHALDLSSRGLVSIPNLKDKNIKDLMLKDNKLEKLETFPVLLQLEKCYLQQNSITTLPAELARCIGLKVLDLRSNRIETIPECLFELANLEILLLSSNRIEVVPDSVSNLTVSERERESVHRYCVCVCRT